MSALVRMTEGVGEKPEGVFGGLTANPAMQANPHLMSSRPEG
jgi:hypothetical protein